MFSVQFYQNMSVGALRIENREISIVNKPQKELYYQSCLAVNI